MRQPFYKVGDYVGAPARFGDSEIGDIDWNYILEVEWSEDEYTYYYKFNNLEVEYWEKENNIVTE